MKKEITKFDAEKILIFNSKKHNDFTINPYTVPFFTRTMPHILRRIKNKLHEVQVHEEDFLLMQQIYDLLGVFNLSVYAYIIQQFKQSDIHNIQDYIFNQINANLVGTNNQASVETFLQKALRLQLQNTFNGLRINNERAYNDKLLNEAVKNAIIDFTNYDNGQYTPLDYTFLYFIQGLVKETNSKAETIEFKFAPYHIDLLRFLQKNENIMYDYNHVDNVEQAIQELRNSVSNYLLDNNLTTVKFNVKALKEAKTLSEIFDAMIDITEEKTDKMAQQVVDEKQKQYDKMPVFDYSKNQTAPATSGFLQKRYLAVQDMMRKLNSKDTLKSKTAKREDILSAAKNIDSDDIEKLFEANIVAESLINYFTTLYSNYQEVDAHNLIQFVAGKHYKSKRFTNHAVQLSKNVFDSDYKYLAKKQYLDNFSGLYYSVNTFKNYTANSNRSIDNIGGVNAFYLDLDIVKNLKPEYKKQFMVRNLGNSRNSAFVYHLVQNILDLISRATKMPAPTCAMLTGHGLQLIWAFKKPIIVRTEGFRNKLISLLKKMNEYVRDQLIIAVNRHVAGVAELHKVFGDKTENVVNMLDTSVFDVSRLLRMPLTYNDKSQNDYHQDFAFPFFINQSIGSQFASLLDLVNYLDIPNYSQQFVKNKTTRKKKASLTHSQKLAMIEKNHASFDKPIVSENELTDNENAKPHLDLKLLLSHTASKDFKTVKQLTQSHLNKHEEVGLLTAKHRMSFTCTRTIKDEQFTLLGKIDPANVKLATLGQTVHVAKAFANDMKKLRKYANLNRKKLPNLFGTIDDSSAMSLLTSSQAVEKVFGQSYYAQTNIVRLLESLPAVVQYWNATQNHYRNNTMLLVSNLAVGLEQYRLVLPNVEKLSVLIQDDIAKNFDKIVKLLDKARIENEQRQNNWEQYLRHINATIFKNINIVEQETGEKISSLDEDEFQGVLHSYTYAERSAMALSRSTFARKIGLVAGQTDEWFVARGLSAFLDPYKNSYRNPFNATSNIKIGIDGVKFGRALMNEIQNAKTQGYYVGLTDQQIQQEIVYQLMIPFLYAKPQNDTYARQIEKLVKKQQEKQYAVSVFMSNEVLNFKLHDEMNTTEFAEKVYHMSRGSYYRNLKLIGGKQAVEEAYKQLQSFVDNIDDEDIHEDELADFKEQQLISATQHADNIDTNNIITVNHDNALMDDNVAVISELMRNVEFKHFAQEHKWLVNVNTETINKYMNDYINHIYLNTKMSNTSLQHQHNLWLADHYELFSYLYNINQANKDGIKYLIKQDLNNPKINSETKIKIKQIADNLQEKQNNLQSLAEVNELVVTN